MREILKDNGTIFVKGINSLTYTNLKITKVIHYSRVTEIRFDGELDLDDEIYGEASGKFKGFMEIDTPLYINQEKADDKIYFNRLFIVLDNDFKLPIKTIQLLMKNDDFNYVGAEDERDIRSWIMNFESALGSPAFTKEYGFIFNKGD